MGATRINWYVNLPLCLYALLGAKIPASLLSCSNLGTAGNCDMTCMESKYDACFAGDG